MGIKGIDYTPNTLIKQLEEKNLTFSIAESCTGGLISHFITNIEGISKFYKGGVVCYSNESKISILKVDKSILDTYGSVSREVTEVLAINVKAIFKSDIGIGVTCYASPTDEDITLKGLSFVSISVPENTITLRKKYKGSRIEIKNSLAKFAIEQLLYVLK